MLMRDHTVLPATHTFIHKWNKPYLPLLPQLQSVTALWLVLIFCPTESRRLRWPEWLITNQGAFPSLQPVTHSSTNWAWPRVTLLIETNMLPLSEAAILMSQTILESGMTFWHMMKSCMRQTSPQTSLLTISFRWLCPMLVQWLLIVYSADSITNYKQLCLQPILAATGWHDRSWTILNGKLTMLELLNIYWAAISI